MLSNVFENLFYKFIWWILCKRLFQFENILFFQIDWHFKSYFKSQQTLSRRNTTINHDWNMHKYTNIRKLWKSQSRSVSFNSICIHEIHRSILSSKLLVSSTVCEPKVNQTTITCVYFLLQHIHKFHCLHFFVYFCTFIETHRWNAIKMPIIDKTWS